MTARANYLGEQLGYQGEVEFTRTCRATPDLTGEVLQLGIEVRFQPCDPLKCLPPTTVTAKSTIRIERP